MNQMTRRNVLLLIAAIGAGLICVVVVFFRKIVTMGRRFVSGWMGVSSETVVEAGPLSDYGEPGVYTNLKESHGIWVIHHPSGILFALSTICTHLGCTPDWKGGLNKFVCPCHGSEYDATGINIGGPSPRPLERLKVFGFDNRLYIDKGTVFREEKGEWRHPDAMLDLGRE